jgi:hypothetical protein
MAMLNIASLPKHLDEIRLLLHGKKLDVLALNETRFDSSISDDLMSIEASRVTIYFALIENEMEGEYVYRLGVM